SRTSAMPLMPIPPIPTKCTRLLGPPFIAFAPYTDLSGHPVHPANPATCGAYRVVNASSRAGGANLGVAHVGDARGGVRTAGGARRGRHASTEIGVVEQRHQRRREAFAVAVAIEEQRRRAGAHERLRIVPLMVVGGMGIWDQNRGKPARRDLGAAH